MPNILNIDSLCFQAQENDSKPLGIRNSVYSYSGEKTACLNYYKLECVNQNWIVNLFTIYFTIFETVKLIKGMDMPATSGNKLSNEFVVMPPGMTKQEQMQIHKLLCLKKMWKETTLPEI